MSKTVQVHKINPKKEAIINKVATLASNYPVIAVASLAKVRGEQLMSVRKALRGKAEVLVAKNKLAMIGLKKAGIKEADRIFEYLKGQNVLIFSNLDPFKLYLLLEKNKVLLPARAGDIAPEDIIVPAGNTGLPAGPVLSEFREAGIPTKIEAGSIYVTKDSVAVKKGSAISPKLASLLSKLNIKPIKAGISIIVAYQDGVLYPAEAVAIDLEKYRQSLKEAFMNAVSLSVQIGYITPETATQIITKAYQEAIAVALASGYVTKETIGYILSKAQTEALSLELAVKSKKS
jgi:large subunit ribosomal protein L10